MATETVQVTKSNLARLLRDAERAHGEYETTLGHRDDNWPEWYAQYIVDKLNQTGVAAGAQRPTQVRKGKTPTA